MITAFVAGLLALAGLAQSAEDNGTLPQNVVRLYHYNEEGGRIQPLNPKGTAFLVWHGDALYLVSAGHMSQLGDLYARVATAKGMRELMVPRRAWVRHPATSHASSVAHRHRLPGAPPPPPAVRPPDVAVARIATATDWRPQGVALGADPQTADEIIVAGYPQDFLAAAVRQRPLLRKGIVAMKPAEAVIPQAGENAVLDAAVVVLDVLTFGGNSGSPVFAATSFPERPQVTALVTSGDPGLAIAFAEPASRIRETLAHAAQSPAPAEAFWGTLRPRELLSSQGELASK